MNWTVCSSDGYRFHRIGDVDCWCHPEVEEYDDTIMVVHRDVTGSRDTQPRMACFG